MKNDLEVISEKLNTSVMSVMSKDQLQGFEKAYLIATATGELKKLMTPEYMLPIMALQGSRLGFKTDKDNANGYPIEVIKNCLIEAVLTGVQPHGNQFNIIAGNCYITKEGFGYMLKNIAGLSYQIVPQLPRINKDSTSAAITMAIKWNFNGVQGSQDLEVPVKMNKYMGTDAVIGKATRKARAWLFNNLNDTEIGDGDINDLDSHIIKVKPIEKTAEQHESERMQLLINNCKTLEELEFLQESNPNVDRDLFQYRLDQINK